MKDPVNWCRFFARIEANPTELVPEMTIRQYLEAREHVQNCDACFNRAERTIAKAPPDDDNQIGFMRNVN